jgi:hypothetical protein
MSTAYTHLCWKEYRSLRGFWICTLALTVFLQILTLASLGHGADNQTVFNLALAFPVLFAVGSAGVAFAGEREEGTVDFLRAAPVKSSQIFISKLATVALATLAMYALLFLASVLATRNELPRADVLHNMIALWLVAGIEALAWGIFFSLLLSRPLLAVILAIGAASTETHLLARLFSQGSSNIIEWSAYSRAAPLRLLAALVVFAVDIVLGLRWLHGPGPTKKRLSKVKRPLQNAGSFTIPAAPAEATVHNLLSHRDRSAMLGRLIWQQVRQSAVSMSVIAALMIAISLLSLSPVGQWFWKGIILDRSLGPNGDATYVPLALFAALAGCCVFQADQQRRSFRFFVEHNVPPRYVWFSRQLPWILLLAFCLPLICFAWLIFDSNVSSLWGFFFEATYRGWISYENYNHYLYAPPLVLGIACFIVSYAAGQFASMFVRSAILAGFAGLCLSAMLCFWVRMMHVMQVPFWWSVLPIPLVLLAVTWWHAPDWIAENRRWSARLKIASAVLLPAVILCIRVPYFRVHEVSGIPPLKLPSVAPPNTVSFLSSLADYQSHLAESLQTAELYRQAEKLLAPRPDSETASEKTSDRSEQTSEALDLVLEASSRPYCSFADYGASVNTFVPSELGLVKLVLDSGRQFQAAGKLDEALDRYLAALRIVRQFSGQMMLYSEHIRTTKDVFAAIKSWALAPGQTPDSIRNAIVRLQSDQDDLQPFEDYLLSQYVLTQRVINGDETAWMYYYPKNNQPTTGEILWNRLMPWESARATRVLNQLAQAGLLRLFNLRLLLDDQLGRPRPGEKFPADHVEVSNLLPLRGWDTMIQRRAEYFQTNASLRPFDLQRASWMETTSPSLNQFGEAGVLAANKYVEFETQRRATAITLALIGYRLKHHHLPAKLSDLAPEFFDTVPPDPYSGIEFVYYPQGVPHPETPLQEAYWQSAQTNSRWDNEHHLQLNVPGLWSMGPHLKLQFYRADLTPEDTDSPPKEGPLVPYYTAKYWPGNNVPVETYEALSRGFWFPIPESTGSTDKD